MITLRKCADRAAYFHTEKRDVARESARWGRRQQPPAAVELAALNREPLPDEAAAAWPKRWNRCFAPIDDPDERAGILELSLQGHTAVEISEQPWSGRAIRAARLREHIRKRLERMQAETE